MCGFVLDSLRHGVAPEAGDDSHSVRDSSYFGRGIPLEGNAGFILISGFGISRRRRHWKKQKENEAVFCQIIFILMKWV